MIHFILNGLIEEGLAVIYCNNICQVIIGKLTGIISVGQSQQEDHVCVDDPECGDLAEAVCFISFSQ